MDLQGLSTKQTHSQNIDCFFCVLHSVSVSYTNPRNNYNAVTLNCKEGIKLFMIRYLFPQQLSFPALSLSSANTFWLVMKGLAVKVMALQHWGKKSWKCVRGLTDLWIGKNNKVDAPLAGCAVSKPHLSQCILAPAGEVLFRSGWACVMHF